MGDAEKPNPGPGRSGSFELAFQTLLKIPWLVFLRPGPRVAGATDRRCAVTAASLTALQKSALRESARSRA